MNIDDLEDKFLYRALKVIYYLSLIALVFAALLFGYLFKPVETLNRDASFVVCNNGQSYTYSRLDVSYPELDTYEDSKARYTCQTGEFYPYKYTNKESPLSRNYTIEVVYSKGTWINTLMIVFLGIPLGFLGINLIRETLMYLFFKKFDLSKLLQAM